MRIVQKVKDLKAVLKKPAPMWALLILLAVTLCSTIVSAQIIMTTTFATIGGATYTITGEAEVTKIEIKVGKKTATYVLEVTVKNTLTEKAKFDVRVVYEDMDLEKSTGSLAIGKTTSLEFDTGLKDLPSISAATVYVTKTS